MRPTALGPVVQLHPRGPWPFRVPGRVDGIQVNTTACSILKLDCANRFRTADHFRKRMDARDGIYSAVSELEDKDVIGLKLLI